jgi:S1-C subfamily serine protease
VAVTSVVNGSPAGAAGIRPGDLVVAVDGVAVEDVGTLQALMDEDRIGRRITVEIVRGDTLRTLSLVPTELP